MAYSRDFRAWLKWRQRWKRWLFLSFFYFDKSAGRTKTWAREWSSTCNCRRRLGYAPCCRLFGIHSLLWTRCAHGHRFHRTLVLKEISRIFFLYPCYFNWVSSDLCFTRFVFQLLAKSYLINKI